MRRIHSCRETGDALNVGKRVLDHREARGDLPARLQHGQKNRGICLGGRENLQISLPPPGVEKDCGRLENGVLTTSAAEGTSGVVAQGCIDQLELGIYRINKRIRERRYPLVDTERGVVVSSAFFDHANTFSRYSLTDGREMDTLLKWPNSITLLEAFRVRDGKIHRIEALFTYVPYFMHSPWAKPGGVGAQ